MRTIWSLKYALLALALLALGWCLLNIWVVMAGTLVAIAGISRLTKADVVLPARLGSFLAITAMLVGLHLYSGNKDLLLAAVVYVLCGLFTPWRHPSEVTRHKD